MVLNMKQISSLFLESLGHREWSRGRLPENLGGDLACGAWQASEGEGKGNDERVECGRIERGRPFTLLPRPVTQASGDHIFPIPQTCSQT